MGKHIHRISNVDHEARTLVCEECGPCRLYMRRGRAMCREARMRERGWKRKAGYRYKWVGGAWVAEHRLVMERSLGRALLPHETPHHVNGDRADNRPENLELWSSSQPAGQRVADKVAWAHEIIALYGDLRA